MSWLTGVWVALVIVGGYFLLYLPRRRMRQEQLQMRRDLDIGDEVITVAGIIGMIQDVDDDEVRLEIAPDVVVRVVRRGVVGRLAGTGSDEPDERRDGLTPALSARSGLDWTVLRTLRTRLDRQRDRPRP